MTIRFCEHCAGNPYTDDVSVLECPECGAALSICFADEAELQGRRMLVFSSEESKGDADIVYYNDDNELFAPEEEKGSLGIPVADTEKRDVFTVTPDNVIKGKILQYSSSGREDGQYRRLLPVKLYQAIVYHQRLEDVLHRFAVRIEGEKDALGYGGYTDIPVNVHGTISGGLQLTDNAEVEVRGKYLNGVLMAQEINLINNGYKSKVGFQRNVGLTVSLVTIGLLLIGMLGFSLASSAGFLDFLGMFGASWLVSFLVFTVLYFILSFTKVGLFMRMVDKKERHFPFMTLLIISFVTALLFTQLIGY